ncbi:hypothetical protein GPY61_30360 [Massilia sp. NEAU-DD11]|uniref:Uncharacterized protein n=1 Tax=Massilia cellulosiltytica TaxID=2683234 RepID=A0A7X3G5V0_9BURK|nr:hypothetical protein [Telluria cellulosilytica]MVW64237.1 hypothetical protein [Telluria cellulosilytica]
MRSASSGAPLCPLGRRPRAHYRLADGSIDVTDLLNSDFELVELTEGAITHLGVASTAQPVQVLRGYAEQVLTLVLDLQTDRVLELLARLTSAAGERGAPVPVESMPTDSGVHTTGARPFLHAACAELNRLKGLAPPTDYAMLKTGGRDRFSAMRLGRLADIIPAPVWIEMQIRLRAAGLLTPVMD